PKPPTVAIKLFERSREPQWLPLVRLQTSAGGERVADDASGRPGCLCDLIRAISDSPAACGSTIQQRYHDEQSARLDLRYRFWLFGDGLQRKPRPNRQRKHRRHGPRHYHHGRSFHYEPDDE